MDETFKSRKSKVAKSQNSQRGYMLITLMLGVTLMAIALFAILPAMRQQIQRDQEEEMRHRGTSYMRAIQHYYKRLGRYPTRLEDLENTNNVRFLRKRYKDPITGKDFKLLHMQDVNLNNGPGLGGAAGLAGLAGLAGQAGAPGGLPGGGLAGAGGAGGLGGLQGALGQAGLAQVQQQLGGLSQGGTPTLNQNNSGDDSSGSGNSGDQSNTGSGSSSTSGPSGSSPGSSPLGASAGANGQVIGGGPILGVASTSKTKTIREFNGKNHYNDWLFIYDPTSDRGGLLVGPWQIPPVTTLPGATPAGQLGQGTAGQPGQGLGQGFGAGTSQPNNSPFQNSPFQSGQQPQQQNPPASPPDQ